MPKSPQIPPIGQTQSAVRAIETVAFQGVQLLDVTGPLQVFATANETIAKAGGSPPYTVRVVARQSQSVVASAGVVIGTDDLPSLDTPVDTLIIAGGPGVKSAAAEADLVSWVGDRAQTARRTASVCTGAYLLAATGILDGRRAVTHWSFCDDLARCFPAVRVEGDPIFVRDGSVWTSAGVTAGIDLALALVEEDLGRDVALAVARYLVVFLKRPGGQAQFSAALSVQLGEEPFGPLHAWIVANLSRDLSLSALAARAGMSERSFSRRYLAATGLTPARAVDRLRVEAARRLLSDTRAPIKRVARQCGFGTEETMRRSFLRLLSTSPQDYRARFSM
ncbi:MAG: GlxA family transcriptional regulator [Hyphomicrobiales bacterium]|nr:GlxA family transcriptional regulator [Hyphomicrobiales bacterium]MBV8662443.1 GlxA family transcriptional regulator [Hyphomicrobiales bacterium]